MFGNLIQELRKKQISNKTVSELLGCSEKTFYNKANGITEFTLRDVLLISENLLPEFDLRYLFRKTETERTA